MTKKGGVFFLCLAGIFVLYSCVSYPVSPTLQARKDEPENTRLLESGPAERRLIRSEPELKPVWKDSPPKSGEEFFFVGVSKVFSTAAGARNDARENAFIQVMRFYGEFIRSSAIEKTYVINDSAETLSTLINREEEISNFAQAVVSQVGTDQYYTEIYLNGQNQEEYVVYALCQIPRQRAEQDIANFAKNTSERYANLLATPPTFHSTLLLYGDTLTALEQNPLHRAVAYYDGLDGRVNLYEYLSIQLNILASSVSFAPLSPGVVEKPDTLDTTVTVSSPRIAAVGTLECGVNIYGMNNQSPNVKYTVGADNTFSLKIFTSRLEPGKYTVQLELLLNEINPRIRKNPVGGFSLEVKPMSASADFVISGDSTGIGEAEKNIMVQGILQGIQTYSVPVSLKIDTAERWDNSFTVTLKFRQQAPVPPSNRTLVICDAAIVFVRNGVIQESASKQISEIDTAGTVSQVRKFIGENQIFFQNVIKNLSK
jgi:hypothetical protein